MAVTQLRDLLPEVCRNPVERSRLDAIPRCQDHAPFDMRGRTALPEKRFRQSIVVRSSPQILDLGLGEIREPELDTLRRGNSLANFRCSKARQQDQSEPAGQSHYHTSDHARPRQRLEVIGPMRSPGSDFVNCRTRHGRYAAQYGNNDIAIADPHAFADLLSDRLPFIGGVWSTSSVILRALVVAGSRAPDCTIDRD
jgi:hypothetical protein